MESLQDAIEYVNRGANKGVNCPCCTQFAKIYNRKLYATPVLALISLFKLDQTKPGEYFHLTDILKASEDGLKLRILGDSHKANYFGLIEEMPKDEGETGKKNSGYWRITEKGKLFVLGEITVPQYAKVLYGKVIGFSDAHISVKDALGKRFDYKELMSRGA